MPPIPRLAGVVAGLAVIAWPARRVCTANGAAVASQHRRHRARCPGRSALPNGWCRTRLRRHERRSKRARTLFIIL